MKKFIICLLTLFSTLTLVFYYQTDLIKVVEADEEAPIITLLDNDMEFYDDEEFNYYDYIEVSDQSNVEMDVDIDEDSYDVGYHEIRIVATDEQGNTSYGVLRVTIKSVEEINDYVRENSSKTNFQYTKNNNLLEEKGHADLDAFELAREFIGMGGSCHQVAQAYINAYFGTGYNVLNTYSITAEEAEPGDIIFYTNSGFGQQHYAVYLGGSSALHGNINGTTVVSYVYMNYGSTPQFRRLTGR